ncbi:MAG: PAS domain-containing protein, partial [Natronomonas sp.]
MYTETTPPLTDATILLVAREGNNRRLLSEWLSGEGFDVVVADGPEGLPETYDLCLVDTTCFRQAKGELQERRTAAQPVFLPHLLLLPATEAGRNQPDVTALVDDVVELPADQTSLRKRIDNLLLTRQTAKQAKERTDLYQELVETMPDGLLLVDGEEIVYGNEAAARLLAVESKTDLAGHSVLDFVPPAEVAAVTSLLDGIRSDAREDTALETTLESSTGASVAVRLTGVTATYDGERMV